MNPTLQIHDLHKSFHGTEILSGVSLTAYPKDVIALLGSSGSGKSTLLRCMNLLEIPDVGQIEVAQEQIALKTDRNSFKAVSNVQVARIRRQVGMVFQQFNLWTHLTVLENIIAAPMYVLKQSRTDAIQVAQKLLEKVGLAHKQHHYPSQLSGGQQQRIAIARALAMNPTILLFDEPTSALDPEKVSEVAQIIKALAGEGKTMVIATHEMAFAKQVASHVIFLDHGKIHEQGSPQEMFAAPKTTRFKQFIESMNENPEEENPLAIDTTETRA